MRRGLAALFAVIALSTGLTACVEDPCAGLEITDREREILELGGEVEREVGETECELSEDGKTWEQDTA